MVLSMILEMRHVAALESLIIGRRPRLALAYKIILPSVKPFGYAALALRPESRLQCYTDTARSRPPVQAIFNPFEPGDLSYETAPSGRTRKANFDFESELGWHVCWVGSGLLECFLLRLGVRLLAKPIAADVSALARYYTAEDTLLYPRRFARCSYSTCA